MALDGPSIATTLPKNPVASQKSPPAKQATDKGRADRGSVRRRRKRRGHCMRVRAALGAARRNLAVNTDRAALGTRPSRPAFSAGSRRTEPLAVLPPALRPRTRSASPRHRSPVSRTLNSIQNPDPAPPRCGRAAFFIDAGDQNSGATEKNSGADIKRPGAAPIKCDLDDQKLETALNKCSLGAKSIEPAARRIAAGSPKRVAAVPERGPEVP